MPNTFDNVNSLPSEDSSGWVVRLALRFGVGIGLGYAAWLVGLHLTGNNAFGPKRMLVQFAIPLAVVASQWTLRRVLRPRRRGCGGRWPWAG